MIVAALGPQLPLVDHSPSALGPHAVLGGQVLGKHPVPIWVVAEQRQATGIAHGNRQACLDTCTPFIL
jgi:hypothetical protein